MRVSCTGSLPGRECLYAAAAVAWAEGNYVRAGQLLESVILQNPGDLLAVRLAQDAYMTCGSTENALGCLIRHPSTLETPQHLTGYLLGILATGYTETGRPARAVEDAERGVEASRGENGWSLYALMNAHQVTCNSSEIYSKWDEYEKKHEGAGTLCLLHYNRGSAHIMRGNYSAAFKSIDELFSLLETEVDGEKTLGGPAWTNAVLLLWQLTLNTRDFSEDTFEPLWKVLSLYAASPSTPLQYLCTSLVYSSAAVSPPTRLQPPTSSTGTAAGQPEAPADSGVVMEAAKGFWGRVTSALTEPNKARRETYVTAHESAVAAQRDSLRLIGRHIRTKYSDKIRRQAELGMDLHQLFAAHIDAMRTPLPSTLPAFPALRAVEPTVGVVRGIRPMSSSTNDETDLQYCLRTAVAPLSEALHAFNERDYVAAGKAFVDLNGVMTLVGGTAAQRMVFEQMAIERYATLATAV
jgi:hypothetical protein